MAKQKKELYKDPSMPVDVRVNDLLGRMTLREKINQITSEWGVAVMDDKREKFSHEKAKTVLKDGIGQMTRPGGGTSLEPQKLVKVINQIQRFLIESTRLGIPAILHEECLMGYQMKGTSIFPQSIGVASTWDPDLVKAMSETIRTELKALKIHQALAPVLDIAREPRWGRVEETYGEDPYLVASMSSAYIKGLQGDIPRDGIMATCKHFAGYSQSEGGMNWAPTHIPPREFREINLFPFEVAVRHAKAMSVMNAYHEHDGIPCGASRELLTNILRKEWGFQGIVVSDYDAIISLHDYHKIASSPEEAQLLALKAGLDVELPNRVCVTEKFMEYFERGQVSEKILDESVARILRMKFIMGIFEDPYIEPANVDNLFDTEKSRSMSRKVAQMSITLLKNVDNVLPLRKDFKKISVIGPNADSWRNLLGDYCYQAIVEYRKLFREKLDPSKLADLPNTSVPVVTVLEGIRSKVSKNTEIMYAKGCDILSKSKDGFDEAVYIARQSDVAIVVLGGKSGFTSDCTSGEERDTSNLGLYGVQEELLKAIFDTGTPVVLVLVDGRPLAIEWATDNVPAIIEAWLPGEEGGNAIADVLFGDINPGGKLPLTFPRHVGQVPVFYNHKPSARRSHLWGDYVEGSASPLYPFGHGLSYTSFKYTDLRIKPERVPPAGKVQISVRIKNVGKMSGDEVIQLYINDKLSSVTRPVKELKGFKRITLKPDESKWVTFELSTDQLAFYDTDMKLVVEPGAFKVMVGSSSQDIRLSGEFTVVGEKRVIEGEREYFSKVEIDRE